MDDAAPIVATRERVYGVPSLLRLAADLVDANDTSIEVIMDTNFDEKLYLAVLMPIPE